MKITAKFCLANFFVMYCVGAHLAEEHHIFLCGLALFWSLANAYVGIEHK